MLVYGSFILIKNMDLLTMILWRPCFISRVITTVPNTSTCYQTSHTFGKKLSNNWKWNNKIVMRSKYEMAKAVMLKKVNKWCYGLIQFLTYLSTNCNLRDIGSLLWRVLGVSERIWIGPCSMQDVSFTCLLYSFSATAYVCLPVQYVVVPE